MDRYSSILPTLNPGYSVLNNKVWIALSSERFRCNRTFAHIFLTKAVKRKCVYILCMLLIIFLEIIKPDKSFVSTHTHAFTRWVRIIQIWYSGSVLKLRDQIFILNIRNRKLHELLIQKEQRPTGACSDSTLSRHTKLSPWSQVIQEPN